MSIKEHHQLHLLFHQQGANCITNRPHHPLLTPHHDNNPPAHGVRSELMKCRVQSGVVPLPLTTGCGAFRTSYLDNTATSDHIVSGSPHGPYSGLSRQACKRESLSLCGWADMVRTIFKMPANRCKLAELRSRHGSTVFLADIACLPGSRCSLSFSGNPGSCLSGSP